MMHQRRNRTYFDGDLARCLKDAALEVIEEHGTGAVSLRALARNVGVSHNAHTKHFADKAQLFAALAADGFDLIDARFAEVSTPTGPTDSPADRLARSAKGFVEWAGANRAYHLVMWQPNLWPADTAALDARQRTYRRWVELLGEAHAAGLGDALPLTTVVDVTWAAVTGLAGQLVNGMNPNPTDNTELVVDTLIYLLASGPAMPPS